MMQNGVQTKWLHNPLEGDITFFYRQRGGVSVEHMLRPASFDMRCNHFHPEYEIYLLLRGRRRLFFGNRSYLMEAGSLAVIDSRRIHMTHSVPNDPDTHYERIILYVHKEKMDEYDRIFPDLKMSSFLRQHDGVYVLSSKERERIMEVFQVLMQELDKPHSKSHILLDLEIIKFLINFWRKDHPVTYLVDKKKSTQKGKYSTVYAVSDYISAHFCKDITLEKLAAEFYVSKSYLSRSFKEVVGVGFKEYVNLLRIRKAQELLEDSTMTISEISEAVGFESASYFGQVFLKHLEVSPTQYRKDLLHVSTENIYD